MSKFEKSTLTINGDEIHVSMPFSKVDKAKRTVSGYATLDNIDSQGDIVTAEASAKAFARARGNLREMHDKVAVGRIVDFKENEYLDPETGDLYRGIYVTAYVSKGAPDTWEKVLDGTLSGFSIGGEINEASNEFVKELGDGGRTVRFIKDYDLVELSLVDNPANQLANIFSIQKSATGSVTVTGMVADTQIESVFICKEHEMVLISTEDSAACPKCEQKMENAGWFESGPDRAEKAREIVNKFLTPNDAEATPDGATSEGGVEMAQGEVEPKVPEGTETEVVNPSEEFPDGEKVEGVVREEEDAETVDETAGTEEESAETPEEVQDDETVISKKIDELHQVITESLEKTHNETQEHVSSLEKKIEEIDKSFTQKASELEEKLDEFGQKLETTKARQAELQKSLDLLNASDAFKKSADSEDEKSAETVVQKSTWNGAFSGKKFSIDNHV